MGRRRVLEIQDGSQLTGRTDICETVTYIIKIPMVSLQHSTTADSQEVYLSDSNNDRHSEMAAETVYICMYTSGFDRHLDFHNECVVRWHSLTWFIYFAMFENSNAIFHGNPLFAVDDDLLLLPVLSVILKMYKYRCLYSCLIILPFSISNIQKYHICEVYIFAS